MRHKVLAAGLLLVFLPLGLRTLRQAFGIEGSPHVFVMLVFSGSLMLLIGLCGLVGLLAPRVRPLGRGGQDGEPGDDGQDEIKEKDNEKSAAPGGRHP
ncbi:MAG: hypothetical protein LBP92_13490 [Deltaproteobacteria bacterium]|nr:hypothetical protein [Deltaproteobacteria bacterium]